LFIINIMKTRKKRYKYYRAICVFHDNKTNVSGIIKFTQRKNSKNVKIEYEIKGLKNGKHGFHIHEYGDLTDGCISSCSHFNPYNTNHGGRHSKERHVGDLGNITTKNGVTTGKFYDDYISLNPKKKCCIIGRCVVVHDKEDDLGQGGDEESLKTGNAGKRLACGVIGLQKKC